MRSWKHKMLGLVASALIAVPGLAFAASCTCFCGTAESGALPIDGTMPSGTECAAFCDDVGDSYVGCYEEESDYPQYDDKCWTKEECETWSSSSAQGMKYSQWGVEQPSACSYGMHYCYTDYETDEDAEISPLFSLNVPIGTTAQVGHFGEYVVIVYQWMIPAMALVAVVMLMIGGLQYALARGKSKYIDAAKSRITNAITGIVLLLSAYVIVNIIDPRLVSLDALRTPLIKEVTLLDANSTCKALADNGFTIQASSTSCGDEGEVEALPASGKNTNVNTGSWKIGDTCRYDTCSDNKTCVQSGGEWQCVTCAEYPNPSESSCSSMEQKAIGTNNDSYLYCNYYDDGSTNSCVSTGTNPESFQGFTCTALERYAERNNKGCEVYSEYLYLDWQVIDGSGDRTRSTGATLDTPIGDILEEVCTDDPCGIGAMSGGTCQYYAESTYRMIDVGPIEIDSTHSVCETAIGNTGPGGN